MKGDVRQWQHLPNITLASLDVRLGDKADEGPRGSSRLSQFCRAVLSVYR